MKRDRTSSPTFGPPDMTTQLTIVSPPKPSAALPHLLPAELLAAVLAPAGRGAFVYGFGDVIVPTEDAKRRGKKKEEEEEEGETEEAPGGVADEEEEEEEAEEEEELDEEEDELDDDLDED